MELIEKRAFDALFECIVNNRKSYNREVPGGGVSDGKTRLTVLGLATLSSNHPIDDYPHLFGVTKTQAHIIRAYFHNAGVINYVKELYAEFPKVFEGESKGHLEMWIKNPEELDIPLF